MSLWWPWRSPTPCTVRSPTLLSVCSPWTAPSAVSQNAILYAFCIPATRMQSTCHILHNCSSSCYLNDDTTNVTLYHQTLPSITKRHTVSPNATLYHQTSHCITKRHTVSPNVTLYHQTTCQFATIQSVTCTSLHYMSIRRVQWRFLEICNKCFTLDFRSGHYNFNLSYQYQSVLP